MPATRERLWVVMPAYNEEASVERVIGEWLAALRVLGADIRFLAINDGSRDATLARLRRVAAMSPEVEVVDQSNRGHGPSCLEGYRAALAGGADWVLQIDSDGQCDPRFFPALWAERQRHAAVFGYRARRDDGWMRWVVSRLVSLAVLFGAGVWVRDANVPYRLMRRDVLAGALEGFPADFHLANILLAVRLRRRGAIDWVPIRFRVRFGGAPSLGLGGLARRGATLVKQLAVERRRT